MMYDTYIHIHIIGFMKMYITQCRMIDIVILKLFKLYRKQFMIVSPNTVVPRVHFQEDDGSRTPADGKSDV